MLTTFKEIQRRVQQRIQNDTTSTSDTINDLIPKLKVWINERYDRVLRAKPWECLKKSYSLQIVASQKSYALNRDIGIITSVFDKTNGRVIKRISLEEHIRNNASALDVADNVQTGDPTQYYHTGLNLVKNAIGSSAEKVSVVSTSASDVSPLVVHIKGLVSSIEVEEDVILTGTSSVDSSNTYDASQKLEVSLGTNDGTTPEAAGVITVSGKTSGTVFTKISEWEIATEYQWIDVVTTPKSSGTQPVWDIHYLRKHIPLKNNNDIPILDCSNELVTGAYADALREDGQEGEANTQEQLFAGYVEELWASQHNPYDIEQFIPYDRNAYITNDYGRTNYLD